jgi:long-subunit acyl-CoA synthetase (AMP-forming)
MYTSGTTGAPKGTVYTHRQLTTAFACLDAALAPPEDLSTVAFIPFAHAGQRAMGHYRAMLRGASTTFCADPTELPAAIADARPTSLFAPPAVWQRLAAGLHTVIDADRELREVHAAALARVRRRRAGGPAFELTASENRLLTAARARVGLDRLTEPFVSAAPSPPELLEDLYALGVPVINVYALTELPPITATRPDPADIGTTGRPLPGVEIRLGPDSEVLVRHAAASSGYHRRPASTATLFPADGWAHTGDVGTVDTAGRLHLDGRRDERFATSFGTNVDPVLVEAALKGASPAIAHACVIGAGRPFLVALIVLHPGSASRDLVAAAVERVNAGLPATARIAKFRVLEDTWAPGSDELTPTLKLRRSAVQARYAEHIESLYR